MRVSYTDVYKLNEVPDGKKQIDLPRMSVEPDVIERTGESALASPAVEAGFVDFVAAAQNPDAHAGRVLAEANRAAAESLGLGLVRDALSRDFAEERRDA